MAYFKVLFQKVPGRIEKSTDFGSFRISGTRSVLKTGTSRIPISRATAELTRPVHEDNMRELT
jgi:hypothetical protein